MDKVSTAEFLRNSGVYQDQALVRPVVITKHGKERFVLMSIEEYQELKKGSRQAIKVSDLSDNQLNSIAESVVPDQFKHLDNEIED